MFITPDGYITSADEKNQNEDKIRFKDIFQTRRKNRRIEM